MKTSKEQKEKVVQCPLTQIWRINKNGAIAPIISDRNRPNELGIKYKDGTLKKNKVLKDKEIAEASV